MFDGGTMENCVFAIDFTHESMTAAFVDADGVEADAAGFDLSDFRAGEKEPLEKLVTMLMAKCRAASHSSIAVAIAMPCDLDKDRNTILRFPEATWLDGQKLPEILHNALDLPVTMERRSVAFLAFDMMMLGIPTDSLVMGCYMDTHYENAIWHRGAPMLGHNGAAGNIAHITIHDREDNCFCGKSGCVDLYGAGIRLKQIHTMIFPDTPLPELFVRHGEHPIFRDFLTMMAYPIAMEANILDPDFIVLGGSIASMKGFPRSYLEDQIRHHHYSPTQDWPITFMPSSADSVSGVLPISQYARMNLGIES